MLVLRGGNKEEASLKSGKGGTLKSFLLGSKTWKLTQEGENVRTKSSRVKQCQASPRVPKKRGGRKLPRLREIGEGKKTKLAVWHWIKHRKNPPGTVRSERHYQVLTGERHTSKKFVFKERKPEGSEGLGEKTSRS